MSRKCAPGEDRKDKDEAGRGQGGDAGTEEDKPEANDEGQEPVAKPEQAGKADPTGPVEGVEAEKVKGP